VPQRKIEMKQILVSRFSSLGDVAISVHIINTFLEQNKDIEIILLTKPQFKSLFSTIDRVICFDVDFQNKHKGFFGIRKLCEEIIKKFNIEYFADLHNVIRTNLIKFFLPLSIKKAKIDKGKLQKRRITRKKNKKLHQLKHTAERYVEVFNKLGFRINLNTATSNPVYAPSKNIAELLRITDTKIGIAPIAKHKSKTYPIEKTEEIVKELSKNNVLLIFGGGIKDKEIAEKWEKENKNVISVVGKYSMTDEIALLNNCKAVITMDSGNMHLASLTKTKIISIWGATHPFLGFYPFNKPDTIYIQKNITCRPCSVFGNKKCYKGTYECLDIDFLTIINSLNI